jgi:acetyl-CoA carboxylase biotin carboxyl carrier protein
MADGDGELIRHALKTAREFGFQQVKVKSESLSFSATLDPDSSDGEAPFETLDLESLPEAPKVGTVIANAVGYFNAESAVLSKGSTISAGDKLGSIMALGIPNEVTSKVSGQIKKVLVSDGQPVEFGQVIAEVQL